jgi:hypothetical protein
LWIISIGLASCHTSSTWNFNVAPRSLKNLCTPGFKEADVPKRGIILSILTSKMKHLYDNLGCYVRYNEHTLHWNCLSFRVNYPRNLTWLADVTLSWLKNLGSAINNVVATSVTSFWTLSSTFHKLILPDSSHGKGSCKKWRSCYVASFMLKKLHKATNKLHSFTEL